MWYTHIRKPLSHLVRIVFSRAWDQFWAFWADLVKVSWKSDFEGDGANQKKKVTQIALKMKVDRLRVREVVQKKFIRPI